MNGYQIFRIDNLENKKIFKIYEQGATDYLRLWVEQDIKSIVTHEQFEAMKYKVEE